MGIMFQYRSFNFSYESITYIFTEKMLTNFPLSNLMDSGI